MGVFDTIRTVLAIRNYTDQPISTDSQRRILEAGRLSASARNRQPWHFIVVEDRLMIETIGGMARNPYIAGSAMLIAVAIERDSRWAISDVSRAIQLMILTAWDEGIGSNWVGFGGMSDIGTLLGLPETYDLFALLPFGYPLDAIGKGEKQRKPLEAVASRGSFGTPFS